MSRWLILMALAIVAAVLWSRGPRRDSSEAASHAASGAGIQSVVAPPGSSADLAAAGAPQAAAEAPGPLFTFVAPVNAAALTAALPAPADRVRYVRVDRAFVQGKASPFWRKPGEGRVELPLGDGHSVVVTLQGTDQWGPDRFTSRGAIEGRAGSVALFAWNEGYLHASVSDPVLGTYQLRTATEGLSQLFRVNPARVPPCGGERRPTATERLRAASMNTLGTAPPTHAALGDESARVEVHVLVAHTQAVLSTMTGGARTAALQSAFDLTILQTNTAFEASLITARVRLVGVVETQYNEAISVPGKVQDDALTAVSDDVDGVMDDVHVARDATGADVVLLALDRADSASMGLSFILDKPGDPANSAFAFAVVQYALSGITSVVPHELGHLFGCAHDRENALSGEGAFSYSYGYRFRGADGLLYRDIMAYSPGTELHYFSNPDVVAPPPVGVRLGIPGGQPGESNNALTIERTAAATSVYRLQRGQPTQGALINVATRGYVGTGEQVLIGGFVVEGAQPKRLLIRGAGPALGAFGVPGALADPVVRIYGSGTVMAENDNWGTPVGTGSPVAEIAATAAQAGAFPFALGSRDAAAIVTLPPGAYSAVMEGARGTTGLAMMEAYDIDRDATRVVNLATRAFVDRAGRELYAGFVVDGAAGTTTRILVRVLGPSLARAPFNIANALDDPEMEIIDGAGNVVVKSDDWSSGAQGGASVENDFLPLVVLYQEKQMFATGFAPGNRREPGVLVDLPPGSYSVVVRPFELRSSNPVVNQPARSGVGIVEVYEIKP